jgi:hypothetical protein
MAKALTDIAIAKLKPSPVRREIPDRTPLLYLVIQPTGRRCFALRYRYDGQSRKVTLPPGLSLAAARKAAADAALDLHRGVDPGEARKAARAKAAAAAADTVQAICGQYLAREGDKLRTGTSASYCSTSPDFRLDRVPCSRGNRRCRRRVPPLQHQPRRGLGARQFLN